jgi:putative ABC transport system substrate-binding protein
LPRDKGARGCSGTLVDCAAKRLLGRHRWPIAARAQQDDRVRRIGVLMGPDENDPLAKTIVSAFTQTFADSGWAEPRDVRIALRCFSGDINPIPALAQELVSLRPDTIVTNYAPQNLQ